MTFRRSSLKTPCSNEFLEGGARLLASDLFKKSFPFCQGSIQKILFKICFVALKKLLTKLLIFSYPHSMNLVLREKDKQKIFILHFILEKGHHVIISQNSCDLL